jgi:urea transport system substrate-binding protein
VTALVTLVFPPFRLDLANEQLWRDSTLLPLRPKTFEVLLYLARNPQRLVTKQELLDHIWTDTVVCDELLRGYIRELRETLGDDAKNPRYIETVPARGYRFLLRVDLQPTSSTATAPTDTPSPLTKPTKALNNLRVGILHSLTGTMAWTEGPVVDATLLAIEEVNSRGGLLGRQVLPVVVDGQSEETVFARHAENLIAAQDVCTIFGCWTSSSRKSVLPIVEKKDHLLIYPTQYEGMERSPNIFYTGAAPNQQIVPAVQWAFGFLRKKRFFLVGWNSVYSRAANAIIRDEVQALGGEIVGEEYVLPDSPDVTRIVRSIARSKSDVIFNSLVGDANLFYTRLLRAAGITPAKIPSVYFSIGEIELLSLSTKETLGDYAAWNYFQSLDRPQNRAFIDKFRHRYGPQRVTADPMEAAYLGVHLWAQAVQQAGTTNTSAIRKALRTQKFDAPGGPVRIDPQNQHTWKTMRLGRIVEGGQFEIVWSSEKPIRPEPYPGSRSPAAWDKFLAGLYREWDGHWTKSQQQGPTIKPRKPL